MGVLNPGAGAAVFSNGSASVAPRVGVGVGVSEMDICGAAPGDTVAPGAVASAKAFWESAVGAGGGAAGEPAVNGVRPASGLGWTKEG